MPITVGILCTFVIYYLLRAFQIRWPSFYSIGLSIIALIVSFYIGGWAGMGLGFISIILALSTIPFANYDLKKFNLVRI
ncbi:hypothetical protein [Aureibacillus halotolerans]|uniref:YesK-like protein n=1 Tax=Aureibacillus halotolerans TaxID=1508390 RepID=A0A4R6TT92_9BACI|nr:hypothetical protein [Aureibacillus halotolerans]TDQ32158.1 hypothetical protein EV213_1324 [Aureibacillus halotolerans]